MICRIQDFLYYLLAEIFLSERLELQKKTTNYLIILFYFSHPLLTLINLIFEHKIKPDPQIIVIRSIFSSKKINPNIVVNNNLEKSKDIKFVNFVILRAFVQQKFLVLL